MSQVSIIDIEGNYPQIPTRFDANVGFAIPIANVLEILGDGTTVTTTASGNTITISAIGGSFIGLTPDEGGQVNPVTGNINVFGQQAGVIPIMETHNVSNDLMIENRTWQTQYVVDTSSTFGLQGTFSTIQSAINQAVADGVSLTTQAMIFVRYGTYVENLEIPPGIFIKGEAMIGDPSSFILYTEIQGNHIMSAENLFRTEGILWTNPSPTADMFTNDTVNIINATDCIFNNGTSTGKVFTLNFNFQRFQNCYFYGNSSQSLFNMTSGQSDFIQCVFPNNNGFTNSSSIRFRDCTTVGPIVNSNGTVTAYNTSFAGSTNCITGSGSGLNLFNCQFSSTGNSINYSGNMNISSCSTVSESATNNIYALGQTLSNIPTTAGNVFPHTTKNANFNFSSDFVVYVDSSGGAITGTLPSSTTLDKVYIVKDIERTASINNITISVSGGGTIDGASSFVLNNNGQAVILQYTGTVGKWITICCGSGEGGSDCICVELTEATTLLTNSCNYTNFIEEADLTLPATAEVCDTIEINFGLQGAPTIVQNAGQQIRFGNTTSTVGVTGGMTATASGDCVKLKCITGGTNTLWEVISSVGTWNVF